MKMKVMIFLDASTVWRKHGSTTIIQGLKTRVWNGNIHSYQSKESSNATNSKQRDAFFPSFLNSQGPIAEHYQDRSTTVNNLCYCEMCERLRLAVRSRCWLLSNVVLA
jgi:hypothetical protein